MGIQSTAADTVIVLDFETTGLSPDMGDRAIEIGAVKLESGIIVDKFQRLMNPGVQISDFIENYTGITNFMLEDAPPCSKVMHEFSDFIADYNLVAHNASFDSRFLDSECNLIRRKYSGNWACSMLAARRVYPDAPNHKLGTLVAYKNLPNDGTFHRALADAEMTAHLWVVMLDDINKRFETEDISFSIMSELTRVSKSSVHRYLRRRTNRN
jgi:DNA polymerase-3 subunit epsilon